MDNDLDGMDDALEQKLLDYFTPTIIKFDNESCDGPALDGSGDSNIVVCHIYPIPQQYARSNSFDSIFTHPSAIVGAGQLVPGLIWYKPIVKINCAILYGKDCGALGHTADVEGYNYSLRYIGPDTAAGWMYDTIMQNWIGATIQTISHEGTPCQQIETKPYKSFLSPNGVDTVLVSPDKHGNYLTVGGCGASFICNPGCGGVPSVKAVKPVNIGEPTASLIPDLGTVYTAYQGNDPWSTVKFLNAQGGNAGAIRDKMILNLSSNFITGETLTQAQICPIYNQCWGPAGSAYMDYRCSGTTYPFYGQQLTTGGTYTTTLTSSYGCDSTITITLVDLPAYSSSTNATICNGDAYTFGAQTLTIPGTYTDTLTGTTGCDSVAELILTVSTLPAITWGNAVDTILINAAPLPLTGGTPPGGLYSGPGVYGNTFYPDSAGLGAHTITYIYTDSIGCSDSVTHNISVLDLPNGITGLDNQKHITLYPNPANNILTLNSPLFSTTKFRLSVYNTLGEEMHCNYLLKNEQALVNTSILPNGAYYVVMQADNNKYVQKFVVAH